LRVVKEGGNIAIFPEGNRSYSGKTEYINTAIIALAKKMALPIAIVKIEGGYGVSPRWADNPRKGSMSVRVARVIEPHEYQSLDDCAFASLIEKELYVNEAVVDGEYTSDQLAEYLERAIYYCPKCCSLSSFESHGDEMECKNCGMKVRYLPTKELEGINYKLPYRFVLDWYVAQNDFVNQLDMTALCEKPVYVEEGVLSEVVVYKDKKPLLDKAFIELYGDRFEIKQEKSEFVFKFDDIRAITICGKNKLNFYVGEKAYQFTSTKRFNALKYVNFVFRHRNIIKTEKGEAYDEFLGL
jgi:1-acyl-sn-glycerol-3-phosphate acyltransferase